MTRMTLLTLGLSLIGCSSSSLTDADYEDAAQTISSSMVTGRSGKGGGGGDLGVSGADRIVFRQAVSLARGKLPIGFSREDDHRCRGKDGGIELDITIVCKDAGGNELAKCDDTTDSATVTISQTGSIDREHLMATIDRQGSFSITGLQSDIATFNGDSSFSLDTKLVSDFHDEEVTKTLVLDATSSYQAITFTTEDRHRDITGGSASFEVQAHRTVTGTPMGSHDVDKSFDVQADITFNPDHTATLVLNGTQTFQIDLETGKITKQ